MSRVQLMRGSRAGQSFELPHRQPEGETEADRRRIKTFRLPGDVRGSRVLEAHGSSDPKRFGPEWLQLDDGLTCSPPRRSGCEEALEVERLLPQQHVVDGAAELVREHTHGFALAVLSVQAVAQLLDVAVAQHENCGF